MSAFDAYVQAAFHGGTMHGGGPTFTVVHDAETPLEVGYCDAIVEFFRKGPEKGTSAHAMVGPEKAVKLLPDDVVAWAAGPYANPHGWHLEQTGYARFTRADWTPDDGMAQIRRAAACLREVHDTWGIPKRWCTDEQLRRAATGDRAAGGMTTHQQVARVLGGTTHTDPEENYPRDLLLQAVLTGTAQEDDDMLPEEKKMLAEVHAVLCGPNMHRFQETDPATGEPRITGAINSAGQPAETVRLADAMDAYSQAKQLERLQASLDDLLATIDGSPA